VSWHRRTLARLPALVLLPASAVPFIVSVPLIIALHARESRVVSPPPYPAPAVTLTAKQRRQFAPLPRCRGIIPVLVYHDVGSLPERSATSRTQLARELMLLALLHYHAISINQYDARRSGDSVALPERPILISFDGGLRDSFRGADRILSRYRMQATMFVGSRELGQRDPRRYLRPQELARMQRSGLWQVRYGHATREIARSDTFHRTPVDAVAAQTGGALYPTAARTGTSYQLRSTTTLTQLYRFLKFDSCKSLSI
jgi:hypothetical protein